MENKEDLNQVTGNENLSQDENANSVEPTETNVEAQADNNTQTSEPIVENESQQTEISNTVAEERVDQDKEVKEEEKLPEFSEEELKLKSREDLAILLEDIVRTDDVMKMKSKVAQVRITFNQKTAEERQVTASSKQVEGEAEEQTEVVEETIQKDDLDIRFNAAFNIYKEKKSKFNATQEQLKTENLNKKQALLEELKELINSEESLKKTYDRFNEIQIEWKNIGMVPRTDVNNLWQNYHFLVEKFFDKVRINKELKDLGLKKNLEQKIALCEQTEELLLEESIIKSFKALQTLHKEWREIGPVPKDKKDEIWDRFKAATDKINDRRRDQINTLRDDQQENLEAKRAICEKAEAIVQSEMSSIKEWQDNTNKIKELLSTWKTLGHASKKFNDEIWDRFKTSLDAFYNNKKEYFASLRDEQMNNLNLKIDLCARAEGLKDSTDWKSTTRELIQFQEQWKSIGPTPRKDSDKIWKRFRAACDEFFNAKDAYFKNIHLHEDDNLVAKKELIEKIKAFELSDNKSQNLDALKEFQRVWMEIGHVPFTAKDSIQKEYRSAIDSKFDELNISNQEKKTLNFKSKMEQIKDSPNADHTLYRERSFLVNKLNKLDEEIKLWENNIGFLAKSKNANILRLEFEKKIKRAKQEIVDMKTKIKYLDNID
ncbi:MAG: DUF349 domain-containing protein [Bacteroidales bacterium]|nr:DUF349 domain-containing protein [Bacteroidales bacterium]